MSRTFSSELPRALGRCYVDLAQGTANPFLGRSVREADRERYRVRAGRLGGVVDTDLEYARVTVSIRSYDRFGADRG